MRGLLDTSVAMETLPVSGDDLSISVVTIAELRFGVERAPDPRERRRRSARLQGLGEVFDPLPVDLAVCHAWGDLAAHTAERGRNPRSRAFDLLIAATARVHGLTLLTRDEDLLWLSDVLDVRRA